MSTTVSVWGKRLAISGLLLVLTACGTFSGKPDEPAEVAETPEIQEPSELCAPAIEPVEPVAPKMVIIQTQCPPVDGRNVIGEVEWVSVMPEGLRQKARIDTGAQTTSIGVIATQRFERDGKPWVSFAVKDRETGKMIEMKRPLVRIAKIKRHNAEPLERLVVSLDLTMGDIAQTAEVTLADREQFEFPVLIGRNFLDGAAVVDVSKKFLKLKAPVVSGSAQ
ncbi:MAG: ATP-dependent zinc protease [Candidatus Pelagadaptatus aseana]|uniref:ATP-dependent zinc protease family protein n=1 Tax=Candidatus Pelagadaptatus aseana TaxID=3120508 RepID=UPI0039B29FB1